MLVPGQPARRRSAAHQRWRSPFSGFAAGSTGPISRGRFPTHWVFPGRQQLELAPVLALRVAARRRRRRASIAFVVVVVVRGGAGRRPIVVARVLVARRPAAAVRARSGAAAPRPRRGVARRRGARPRRAAPGRRAEARLGFVAAAPGLGATVSRGGGPRRRGASASSSRRREAQFPTGCAARWRRPGRRRSAAHGLRSSSAPRARPCVTDAAGPRAGGCSPCRACASSRRAPYRRARAANARRTRRGLLVVAVMDGLVAVEDRLAG